MLMSIAETNKQIARGNTSAYIYVGSLNGLIEVTKAEMRRLLKDLKQDSPDRRLDVHVAIHYTSVDASSWVDGRPSKLKTPP